MTGRRKPKCTDARPAASAPSLGALAAGLASVHFGLRLPVIFGAVIVIVAAGWTYSKHAQIAAAVPKN